MHWTSRKRRAHWLAYARALQKICTSPEQLLLDIEAFLWPDGAYDDDVPVDQIASARGMTLFHFTVELMASWERSFIAMREAFPQTTPYTGGFDVSLPDDHPNNVRVCLQLVEAHEKHLREIVTGRKAGTRAQAAAFSSHPPAAVWV